MYWLEPTPARKVRQPEAARMTNLPSQGRGRPAFIPQDILDLPLRRPTSTLPPPVQYVDRPTFSQFTGNFDQPLRRPISTVSPPYQQNVVSPTMSRPSTVNIELFFTGSVIDPFIIYNKLESFIFKEGRKETDFEQMMLVMNEKALQCNKNGATICKYFYVFSQDPCVGSFLRRAFFSHLESRFMDRRTLLACEGPTRYRNFIKWVMAAAHHYRNLLYQPFDELMLCLLQLADEISSFTDTEDIPLYVVLMLRFYYYTSLPSSDGTTVESELKAKYKEAIVASRCLARQKLTSGSLSIEQMNWFMLLLEATHMPSIIDSELTKHYSDLLPGFSLLTQKNFEIKLPKGNNRSQYLKHISKYVVE